MKTCRICKERKEHDAFPKRKDCADGRDYRCRSCEAIRRRNYALLHLEEERRKAREYARARRAEDPDHLNQILRRWRERNPEKVRLTTNVRRRMFPEMHAAHEATRSIKRAGFEAHHWSYAEAHQLDVFFLNKSQHRQVHVRLKYDQEALAFRVRRDGRLLSTRAEHAAFIRELFEQAFVDAPHFEID